MNSQSNHNTTTTKLHTTTLKSPSTQCNSIPRDILRWLHTLDLTYSIQSPIKSEFSTGFIIGDILCTYYTNNIYMLRNAFDNGHSTRAKTNNWSYLNKFFERHSYRLLTNGTNENPSISTTDHNMVNIDNINWCTIYNNQDLLHGVQYNEPGAAVELLVRLYRLLTNRTVPNYITQWVPSNKQCNSTNHTNTLIKVATRESVAYMRPTVSLLIKSRICNNTPHTQLNEQNISRQIINDYSNIKSYNKSTMPDRYQYIPNTTKYDLGPPKSFNKRTTGLLNKTQSFGATNKLNKSFNNTNHPVVSHVDVPNDIIDSSADTISTGAQLTACAILFDSIQHILPATVQITANQWTQLIDNIELLYSEIELASAIQHISQDNNLIQQLVQQCTADTTQLNTLHDTLYNNISSIYTYSIVYNEWITLIHTIVSTLLQHNSQLAQSILVTNLSQFINLTATTDNKLIQLCYSYVVDTTESHCALLYQLQQKCDQLQLINIVSQLFTLESTIDASLYTFYATVSSGALGSTAQQVHINGIQLVHCYASSTDTSLLNYVSTLFIHIIPDITQLSDNESIEWCHVVCTLLLNNNATIHYNTALQLLQQLFNTRHYQSYDTTMSNILCSSSILLGAYPQLRQSWLQSIESNNVICDQILCSNSTLHSIWQPLVIVQCIIEYIQQHNLDNLTPCLVLLISTAIHDTTITDDNCQHWLHNITILCDYLLVELCDKNLCHTVTDLLVHLLTTKLLSPPLTRLLFHTSLYGIMQYVYGDTNHECQAAYGEFMQRLVHTGSSELQQCVINLVQQFKSNEPDKYNQSTLNQLQLR